ncbi:Lysophospholipase 1 [Candida viswanathii]|uniref:Lysophospholipase n=1 Tax=Candida viswanathii TaxID=5486 RepID=A0A367YPS6_9ASCO|nr:Lysophospholipase 1 [Candida viswanathii]
MLLLILFLSLAIAWSPTDSYAPGPVSCPQGSLVRLINNQISPEEHAWVEKRNAITNKNLIEFLKHANVTGIDIDEFISSSSIKIGIAFSGGGYRAMLSGGGQMSALDNRTQGAWEHGLGGLLQSATYLSGLSGGGWLVGSVALNNFTSLEAIIASGIWDLRTSIFSYGGFNLIKTLDFMNDIKQDLDAKREAGFATSLVDVWGRALSHQFFKDSGPALTCSTLQDVDIFKNAQMPFPILISNGKVPASCVASDNSTVFEFNPFEMGSWDPSLYQFAKMKYLGTNVTAGVPVHEGSCIGGYDNAGFIMGTSSSLFNVALLRIDDFTLSSLMSEKVPVASNSRACTNDDTFIVGDIQDSDKCIGGFYPNGTIKGTQENLFASDDLLLFNSIKSLLKGILQDISDNNMDIAIFKPNPFRGNKVGHSHKISSYDSLFLCDGGEDSQNIPLQPLIQPERDVDVIFAYDNSANFQAWPNGAAMVATYERQFSKQGNGTHFPYVPDPNSFMNLKLTERPTFFGCDARNLTSLTGLLEKAYDVPLVVYTANRPFSYWSNTSTFQMRYDIDERDSIIKNGFEVSTRLNMTWDPEWRTCVGCAIIRREQERRGIEQTDQCKRCFERYCWNGKTDTRSVLASFVDGCVEFLLHYFKELRGKAVKWEPYNPISWFQYLYSRIRWFF